MYIIAFIIILSLGASNFVTILKCFSETPRATVNTWPNWNPVCYNTYNGTYTNPDYPYYEISLDNHGTESNYRLKVWIDK